MKKILFSLAVALFCVTGLSAQTFDYNFPKDDDGDPYFKGQITYDCSTETAVKRMTSYLNSAFDDVVIDEKAKTATIKGQEVNAKYVYNPFAGEFRDNIIFDMVISWANGKVFDYTYSNLRVHSTAKGFANYDNNDPLRQVLKKYDKAKEKLNDSSLNKKEKKEAVNEEKDQGETLQKIVETLNEQAKKIEESLE